MTTYNVCSENDLSIGELMPFKADGVKILVYRLDDGFYATQHSCTHIFAPLAKGKIVDNCQIQCPFHKAKFDIRTGQVIEWANFPPGIQLLNAVRSEKALKTYPVKVDQGQVFVDITS